MCGIGSLSCPQYGVNGKNSNVLHIFPSQIIIHAVRYNFLGATGKVAAALTDDLSNELWFMFI